MSKKRQYTKDAINNALNFVLGEGGSVREASKRFGVPRSSIQYKIKNPETKFKSGPDPVLTGDEENALCDFIIQLAKRGFPRKKEDIQISVQKFLTDYPRPNPFRENKPGDVWFRAFLNRHPNITLRTSEGVTNASACVSEEDIRNWFREIQDYINSEGLNEVAQDPARVYNSDETGFNICPKTGKVLAEKGSKNVYQIEKGSSKENVTVLFTFSAAGHTMNPLVIYPYKRIPDRVTLSVPSGWGIGRSDSGWMTAAVFGDFISNCFYPQLLANNIPLPVILFVDGHKTHITMEVSQLCRTLNIHLIALYPNATRILQPADVAAFRPIKSAWKKGLREWYTENNYKENLTKESFAPLLKTVLDKCIKKDTIINGFRSTGLFPFNADNVDYSKCIATKKINQTEEVTLNTGYDYKLTYDEFCDIVGNDIIERCKAFSGECDDYHFQAIYKLWQKFNAILAETNITVQKNYIELNETNNVEDNLTNLCEDDEVEDREDGLILDEHSGIFISRKIEDVKMLSENTTSTEMLNGNNIEEMKQKLIKKENQKGIILGKPDCANSLAPEYNESGPSNASLHSKVKILSNVSLSEYLEKKVPDSPKRKGKRQIERTPFALTSNEYVELLRLKNLKKEEEAAAKENRKKLREEKKKEKENNLPKNKPKNDKGKGKKRKLYYDNVDQPENIATSSLIIKKQKSEMIVCCDACLNSITKRVIQCSHCNKKFHQNCVPSYHRMNIPEDEDDEYLCHLCFHCSNTDSSEGDDIFGSILEESKRQGF